MSWFHFNPFDLQANLLIHFKRVIGPYASLLSAFRTIHREGGLDSFFLGIVPDSLSTFISSFLYFFAYTTLRDRTIAWRSKKLSRTAKGGSATTSAVPVLSALEELGIGCLAGLLAKAVVSPLSNITVRAQTSTKPNPPPAGEHIKTGLVQGNLKEGQHTSDDEDEDSGGYGVPASSLSIAKDIIDEKGWLGLWSGYSSSVLLVRLLRFSCSFTARYKKVSDFVCFVLFRFGVVSRQSILL